MANANKTAEGGVRQAEGKAIIANLALGSPDGLTAWIKQAELLGGRQWINENPVCLV